MSNVSIYEKSWIDLVFEGKNKAYGAYQLRQENSRTSLLALLGGITFFLSAIGTGLFLSSFGEAPIDNTPVVIDDNRITPVDLEPRIETKKPEIPKRAEPASAVKPTNLSNMVVAATPQAVVEVPTNNEIKNTPPASEGPSTGTGTPSTGNEGGTAVIPAIGTGPEKPRPTSELDKLPEYPGGINRFYAYVSKNIDRPDIDEERGEITMSVIMSFVIEKDGTMTEIKALRSTDIKLEKEATRVLKASKVKWEPGIKDGNPVRTIYMLPIKVKV